MVGDERKSEEIRNGFAQHGFADEAQPGKDDVETFVGLFARPFGPAGSEFVEAAGRDEALAQGRGKVFAAWVGQAL
jgi:hypothetical protein